MRQQKTALQKEKPKGYGRKADFCCVEIQDRKLYILHKYFAYWIFLFRGVVLGKQRGEKGKLNMILFTLDKKNKKNISIWRKNERNKVNLIYASHFLKKSVFETHGKV